LKNITLNEFKGVGAITSKKNKKGETTVVRGN